MIDTAGVVAGLENIAGVQARLLAQVWRQKHLESSFRRGLMQNYLDFSVCTRQELDYACQFLKIEVTGEDRDTLMALYRVLPSYPDVKESLIKLKEVGFRLFAFSNGRAADVEGLLENNALRDYFEVVIFNGQKRGL